MGIHLQREIERLKKDLLLVCSIVEKQVERSVRAVMGRDTELAAEVEAMDSEVDRREIEVEEECLKILALYQPVAIDLRQLIAALKINNDLEQIGDMAVNIAHKAKAFAAEPEFAITIDIVGMWEKAQHMLRDSVDALVQMDAALALDVCARDDAVDHMKRENRQAIEAALRRDPSRLDAWLRLLAVSRNLERIADSAVSIAEDVVYMVEGRIVRHNSSAG